MASPVSTSLFEVDFAKLYSIFILVKRTVWPCFKYGNYGSVRIFPENLYQIFSLVCTNPSSGLCSHHGSLEEPKEQVVLDFGSSQTASSCNCT